MGPTEIVWRVRQAIAIRFERWGVGLARDSDARTDLSSSAWVSPFPSNVNAALYVEAADRILAGKWDVFALQDCQLGFPPHWNCDPKTGVEAPLHFGKSIDYRNERTVGNIKYLWELSRHLELVTLAQAWHLTREPRFAEGVRHALVSWLDECPYPLGVHWTSSLELAIRLLNWACAWCLLGGDASFLFADEKGQMFRQRWLSAVYRHCHFISGYLSRHSSANNHLFGELMGLFVASVIWPLWPESAIWREMTRAELEAEAVKQTGDDGVNREQAFWYHHEVADMMLLCLLFGRANGFDFSSQFLNRLERMLEFIAAVMDVAGNVPMVGDSDDALMVRFSREPEFCPYRSLLATGSVLFERGDFKSQARQFDDKSRWLLGDSAAKRFERLKDSTSVEGRRAFPEGGYYVLGLDFGKPSEVKVVVDAGPLGYLSIAAHGHADALAFTLSVRGQEILVDPGTYSYHGDARWRDYFRGTSAHNTLRLDGVEQSVPGGNFMWLTHAGARCDHFETSTECDVFEGVQDGYVRLDDSVLHRRRIKFDKGNLRIEVKDTLQCSGEHFVEIHWHLSERCIARSSGHSVTVECADVLMRVECPPALDEPTVVIGRNDPPLGWISRRLDHKMPSHVIVCAGRIAGDTSLVTLLTIEAGASKVDDVV